ncbi:MAG: hypothetical protein AAFQ63_18995 [Cyanobacteria bacterium J06621_11]
MKTPKHFFWLMVVVSLGLHTLSSRVLWPQPIKPSGQVSETSIKTEEQTLLSHTTPESLNADANETDAIALVQLPPSIPSKKATQTQPTPQTTAADTNAPSLQPATESAIESISLEPELSENFLASEELEGNQNVAPDILPELETSDSFEADPNQTTETTLEETSPANTQSNPSDPSGQSNGGVLLTMSDDFPHLSGAQAGCFGLSNCHQSQGNYRQVVQQLTAQMREEGYQLTEQDDIDGTGHRVFEVVDADDPSQTYYLNVFSDGLDSAVYALTETILSLEELKNLNA